MTFLVTKSSVSDFYIVSRREDTPSPNGPRPLHPAHHDDDDADSATASCLALLHAGSSSTSGSAKRRHDSEPVVFGDVDSLEEMMRGTSCAQRAEEAEEPAPRRRRNAISAFLDNLF